MYGSFALAGFIVIQGAIVEQIVCFQSNADDAIDYRQIVGYTSQFCWAGDPIGNSTGTCEAEFEKKLWCTDIFYKNSPKIEPSF